MMDQAEAACAGARADRSDATPKYSATYDDVHIRLIVVNRESVRARRGSGSRVSKRFSFEDRCHLIVGALLAEIARGPMDTVLVRVEENDDEYGYHSKCPAGTEAIPSLTRWTALVEAQQKRDDAEAKQECINGKLRGLVREIREHADRTTPQRESENGYPFLKGCFFGILKADKEGIMQPSRTMLALRFVAVDVIGAILYFPVWWYTAGALKAGRWCGNRLSGAAVSFGIGVWIRNLFTPMYGQRDISGRIISFFMRLITIFFYSFLLLLLVMVMAVLFGLWLAVPALVVWQFWRQLVGVLFS